MNEKWSESIMKRLCLFTGKVLVLLSIIMGLASHSTWAEMERGVAAKVNNVTISEAEVSIEISTSFLPGMFHSGSDKREKYRDKALKAVIDKELIFQEATRRDVKVPDSEIENIFNERKSQYRSELEFQNALKQSDLTLESYKRFIRKELTVKKFDETVLKKESDLSEKELMQYYKENKKRFVRPLLFNVGHILINILPNVSGEQRDEYKRRAESLYQKIKAGEDFAQVAYESSEDQFRVKGGDLGWVHEGRLMPEVEKAIKEMKIDEIRLVESLYGFHIVWLKDKKPSKQLTFDEVRESLKKELEKKRFDDKRRDLITYLRKKGVIDIKEEN